MIAIVLAAGRGERLGGAKALLAWPSDEGELPLALAHAHARAGDCEQVLIVTRADIAARLAPFDIRLGDVPREIVISVAPDELGPAGSLAAAAAHRRFAEEELVLVTPVDSPPASAATVRALQAAMTPGVLAARPRHGGRRGHPVVVRGGLLERYRAPEPPPLRELLHGGGAAVVDVEVDDMAVLVDVNTADDLGAPPRFL